MPVSLLFADDNLAALRLFGLLLAGEDEVEVAGTAEDGEEAIAKAKELLPGMAFVDVNMPGMSGFQAAASILEASPSTKVVIMTADAGIEERRMAAQCGAVDILQKPVSKDALLECVRRLNP